MSAPETQISPASAAAQAAGATYKVVNRIADWITSDRMQLLNITDRINEVVRKSGVQDGIVHLQSLHKHNDPDHSDCERNNADSHLRGMLMGQSLSLQVPSARVLLGTWQSIILAEFDGPRSRSVAVQISGI